LKFNRGDFQHFYRYCYSLTNNEEDAHDLLQSTLEKWIKLDTKDIDRPRPYFLRMLKNGFIDHYRKMQRRKEDYISDEVLESLAASDDKSLEELVCDKDTAQYILDQSDPETREILYLWACQGYSYEEMSEMLGPPRSTILSKIHRFKKQILKHLDKEEIKQ
jgi:RNA polymerase sigma-70 factor (ECF subfamily)